jgi:hypothetical protein
MIIGATPRELALVAFLVILVIIHSIVPKIGSVIGGLLARGARRDDDKPSGTDRG